MRIGIDASCWANRRGYGRYTREIVASILQIDGGNDYVLFLDSETARRCDDLPPGSRLVEVSTRRSAVDAASASGHRSLRDIRAMSRAVTAYRPALDLFYFPSVYTFFPVRRRLNAVVTIHDTIAERHPELIFPHRQNQLLWKLKVRWAMRQASVVVTVSDAARSAIMSLPGMRHERLMVVPDAVSGHFRPCDDISEIDRVLVEHGLEPGARFILYVGGFSPHKNLATVVDAFVTLRCEERFRDVRLVFVGDFQQDVFHSGYRTLRERVKTREVEGKVVFTGFVPDPSLRLFYCAAQALVLPSIDEGFGLPAVEAMACGTPVAASRAGALPEVVGEAGLLFDPRSSAELANLLRRLLSDSGLRAALSKKGLERAARFTWEKSARAALEVFAEAAKAQ
ncbi:MAG: glycosyltransferase family 4 protein [Acidobacteria bacterium]|nr:glycosyltransferase family 4 protein [Acidobacteriota bacterium]